MPGLLGQLPANSNFQYYGSPNSGVYNAGKAAVEAANNTPDPNAPTPYGLTGMPAGEGVAFQQVNPDELVSNQMNGILADNGQYIQMARASGMQNAASRGLLNSAMAGGISENAAIQNAMPMAQANAQEYAQVGASNQQAFNQHSGERIAADAQVAAAHQSVISAGIYANQQHQNALIQAELQKQQMGQQFQEYGMGLGYQYAGLNQQGSEFQQNLAQSGSQFQQQLQQQMAQFTDTQNVGVGEFQQQMDWQKYVTGLQMQQGSQMAYANMFGAIMTNPNMTATDRQAALGNAQSFFGQMSQQNASIPAFVPSFTVDPQYWATNWTAGG